MMLRAVSILFLVAANSWAAGFDCEKASTRAEHLICAEPELKDLDAQLAKVYRNAINAAVDKAQLKKEQIGWLKERDSCKTSECLKAEYKSRIDLLSRTQANFGWLREHAGKTTGRVVRDKRFSTFVKSISPTVSDELDIGNKLSLDELLWYALGGPPDDVVLANDRYVTFSGCMYHFCPEKGWVWVDLKDGIAVAAVIHYDSRKRNFEEHPSVIVFSNQVDAITMPQEAKTALNEWLRYHEAPRNAPTFIAADGKASKLVLK